MEESVLKPHILYVDDSEDFREIFSVTFGKWFSISTIESGPEALQILKNVSFESVITDYDMDEMNGLDLLRAIKKQDPDMPVIFYTGQGNEEVAREAFISGASDYFTKDLFGFAHKVKLVNAINKAIKIKKIDEAVKKGEEKYRLIAEKTKEVIWTIDMNLVFTYVSPSIYNLLGYTPEEFLNLSLINVLTINSYKKVIESINKNVSSDDIGGEEDEETTIELECVHKKGFKLWVEANASFLRDDRGRSLGIHGIAREITGEKRVRDELRRQDKHFQNILQNSLNLVSIWSLDGIVFYEGPSNKKFLGYDPQDLVGKSIFSIIHKDDAAMMRAAINSSVDDTEGFRICQCRFMHKDGNWRNMQLSLKFEVNERAEKQVVVNSIDITRLKQTEMALEERLKFENQILEILSDMVKGPAEYFDNSVSNALKKIADKVEADGSSLFVFPSNDVNGGILAWHSHPGDSKMMDVNNGTYGKFSYFLQQFSKFETIVLESPEDLPEEAVNEGKWLKDIHFRPIMFIPLISERKIFGALGVYGKIDEKREWSVKLESMLNLTGRFLMILMKMKMGQEEFAQKK